MTASNSMEQMLAMFVSLLVVLAVAIGLAWLWKRLMPSSLLGPSGMDVVASRHVGTKERLLLVKVGERYLLLGVTAHAINTLAEFSAEQLPDALQQIQQPSTPPNWLSWRSKQ
ncbi:flagellar biosynthetic protein FliO [Neiella marina]|nr:flagellar biosynthetic protein FliO [Neiella marina]